MKHFTDKVNFIMREGNTVNKIFSLFHELCIKVFHCFHRGKYSFSNSGNHEMHCSKSLIYKTLTFGFSFFNKLDALSSFRIFLKQTLNSSRCSLVGWNKWLTRHDPSWPPLAKLLLTFLYLYHYLKMKPKNSNLFSITRKKIE